MNLIRRLKSKELSLLTIFKAISRPLIISQLTSVRDSNLSLRILFFFFFARTHHYRSSFHTNVEKQICLSTTTIREWPRTYSSFFTCEFIYTYVVHRDLPLANIDTREIYTKHGIRARHVYETHRDMRMCTTTTDRVVHIYISIKRRA